MLLLIDNQLSLDYLSPVKQIAMVYHYTLGTLLFVLLWLAAFVQYVSLEVKL